MSRYLSYFGISVPSIRYLVCILWYYFVIPVVNCQWGNWYSWGGCTRSCGGGTRTRYRSKTVIEEYGGTCSGSTTATENCNTGSCPGMCNIIFLYCSCFKVNALNFKKNTKLWWFDLVPCDDRNDRLDDYCAFNWNCPYKSYCKSAVCHCDRGWWTEDQISCRQC